MNVIDLDNLGPEENKLFNETAWEIRQEFNALIEALSIRNVNNIDWIVSSIPSRNKYLSPLFVRCCRLVFLKKIASQFKDVSEIVLADRPLAILLRKYFQQQDRHISVRCTENVWSRTWRLLRPFRQFAIACTLMGLRYLGRARPSKIGKKLNESIVLLDTFVLNNKSGDEGSIVEGTYRDRYYPGLLGQLTQEERTNIFYLPTIVGFNNPIQAFRRIRAANAPFLIHDDYLKITDYLNILGHPFRLLMLEIPDIAFEGFQINTILRQEQIRNCSDFISLLGILYYRFARRLAQNKIRVRLLVDWYENQVMDRGMIVGFHRFHPETKIVGYQGYVIAKALHIYTQPNNTELLGQAVPDVVAVTGEGLRNDMLEFCKDVNVGIAPGFRVQKLWRDRCLFPDPTVFSVLVALPIGLDDSAHILRLLISNSDLTEDENLKIYIKPHPTSSPDLIRGLVPGAFPDSLRFVTGDFHDCLEKANLLVSNASSVSLESIAKGIPVIIVAPSSGIIQNPIPESINKDFWAICHNSQQLADTIRSFQKLSKNGESELERSAPDIRKMYFEPVTRNSVLKFLDLNSEAA